MSEVTEFQFRSGSVTLSGLDYGQPELPDMVIVHGIKDLAWSMKPIADEFSSAYHVLVPDLRGHGNSENPGVYTMSYFIADLRALVQARNLQSFVIVAHSLGGHIAGQYAALFPDDVSALVLIDGMGPPNFEVSGEEQQRMDRERITMMLETGQEPRIMTDLEDAFTRLHRNNPGLGELRARHLAEKGTSRLDDGSVIWKWDHRAQQVWNTFSHDENEARLGWIRCPVLMLTAEHSMQYWSQMRPALTGQQERHDREVERRRQLFRDARHVSIEGAGHMIHYDQPQVLNQRISEFLESCTL